MTTWILEVPGMTCGHCESAVKGEVGGVAGVHTVDVDLDSKLVTVVGEGLDAAVLAAAVDEAGYAVASHHEIP